MFVNNIELIDESFSFTWGKFLEVNEIFLMSFLRFINHLIIGFYKMKVSL